MRLLMVVAALVLAACSPAAPPAPAPAEPAPTATAPVPAEPVSPAPSADQTSCIAKGGEWRPVCRMQQASCVMTFADAGKTCADGDDCAGDCMAPNSAGFAPTGATVSGVCAVNDDPCGCKQTVEDGKATAAICID
jgi:putative hemolysin